MGYWARVVLGVGLILAGVAVMAWSIHELTQIGTCASGGPYVVGRECPDGTALKIAAMFPACIAVMVGVWLFAIRGRTATRPALPPKS